jgi:hypothetical protein
MEARRLDCGALAALGRYAVELAGGVALAVQLVERFDRSAVENWRNAWGDVPGLLPWTWEHLIYHEAIALVDGPRVSLWDTTDACCIDGKATAGYDSLAALRISPVDGLRARSQLTSVFWQGRWLGLGVWHPL